MAENNTNIPINGGINGDSLEFLDADDRPAKKTPPSDVSGDLTRKIDALEKENLESASQIGELKNELAILRSHKDSESDRADSASRAAEAIAKRASELEGEVFRLQHDLITAMNTGTDLQAKFGELEEKVKASKAESEAVRREKEAAHEAIEKLEAMLEESDKKVKVMEAKVDELVKKSAESDKVIGGLVEKVEEKQREAEAEAEAEEQKRSSRSVDGGGFEGLKKKAQLPLIGAVSAGAIVVATMGVVYIRYSRK